MLVRNSVDYDTLATALMPSFKEHLRILHDDEDSSINMYLTGAIDAISMYADIDIFKSSYTFTLLEYETYQVNAGYFNTGRVNISDVTLVDEEDLDILETVDQKNGYITPVPTETDTCTFSAGYETEAELTPNIKSIVFRYAAHLYENREAINIGEPKNLPDWVNYALPSIWNARV